MLGEKARGVLAVANKAARERNLAAVDRFLTVTRGAKRVAPRIAPVLASKVLAAASFGPGKRGDKPRKTLMDHFDRVSEELAQLVAPTPAGPKVRPGTRQAIAAALAPVALNAPITADRLQTHAVRRLEFLASKAPKYTQIGMTRIPPSEMAVRAFARYLAAADDPSAIEERLADGTITPEDAEVMRALYPARVAETTRRIMERLGELRGTLPYQRRLALSIYTGAPVDAAMDPRVFAQLQATYAAEPNTEGGTTAPTPQPAFGSVKKPDPTPAQSRAEGA